MSLQAQRRALVASRVFLAMCAAYFAATLVAPLLAEWGVPPLAGVAIGVFVPLLLWTPIVTVSAARSMRDYALARRVRPLVTGAGMAVSLTVVALLGRRSGDMPYLESTPVAAAVVAFGSVAGYLFARGVRDGTLYRRQATDDPELAAELAERSHAVLQTEDVDEERYAIVSMNRAGALLVLVTRPGHEDCLGKAITILEDVALWSPPALAFEAAFELVGAMALKLRLTGDDTGYDRALELLHELGERASADVPWADAAVHMARATRLEELAERAPDAEQAEILESYALEDFEAALERIPEALDDHAIGRALVAHRSAAHPLRGDLDAAVRECRAAVRRVRASAAGAHGQARLLLADVYELRAALEPDGRVGRALTRAFPGIRRHSIVDRLWLGRSAGDLMRAMWLCLLVSFDGELRDDARARLPRLRSRLVEESVIPVPARLTSHTGWMYARVFKEQASLSGSSAADVAAEWVGWATERGDAQQAGEAAWCWVNAVTADLRRRVLEDKARRIGAIQGAVAEAAHLLVTAGRARDAAVALDMGRAVLLTEWMGRDRNDLGARLAAAGHADLAARWQATTERLERADRAALQDAVDEPAHGSLSPSAEYVALVDHTALLRKIAALPGFADVDAPPTYDDLRAAAGEGPLVYLSATDSAGFAIVVTAAGEPAVENLAISRATVDELGRLLLRALDERKELPALMTRIRDAIVRPFVAHVEPGSLVTLIAGGALAELPLHAAATRPDADGVWRDETGGIAFRYVPNARVLLQARRESRALAGGELRVLTVGVTEAPGRRRLPYARAESEGVAALFGPASVDRPSPATAAAVERCLDECDVWHFACHGIHDPEWPLDSTLALADYPLTLRAMLARPRGRRRLAVLSACHSATLAASVPDEVVGFPSAMLQSGVAGVVACLAEVDDYAAMLLVLAFLERIEGDGSFAHALAAAQAWLRAATNADIHAAFPTIHQPPDAEFDDREKWDSYRPFRSPSYWAMFTYTGA